MTALLNITLARLLLAAGLACALVSAPARAQSEASAALSLLPVASVVGTASVGAAAPAPASGLARSVWRAIIGAMAPVGAALYSRPFGARSAIAAAQLNGNQGGEVQQDAIPT